MTILIGTPLSNVLLPVEIFSSTLGADGAFDTGSGGFATDGEDLTIELILRSTVSGTASDVVRMFVNNDTTVTNYRRQYMSVTGSTVSGGEGNVPNIGSAPANGATANYFSYTKIIIPKYASTTHQKIAFVSNVLYSNSTTAEMSFLVWQWNATTAISRIQIRTDNHPTDTFVTGSSMRVYKHAKFNIHVS